MKTRNIEKAVELEPSERGRGGKMSTERRGWGPMCGLPGCGKEHETCY